MLSWLDPLDAGPLRDLLRLAVRCRLAVLDLDGVRTTLVHDRDKRYVLARVRVEGLGTAAVRSMLWEGTVCCGCVGVLMLPRADGVRAPWPACWCPVPSLDPVHHLWLS